MPNSVPTYLKGGTFEAAVREALGNLQLVLAEFQCAYAMVGMLMRDPQYSAEGCRCEWPASECSQREQLGADVAGPGRMGPSA